MKFSTIFRVLGLLLMLFSLSMLPPMGIELWFHDQDLSPYLIGFIATLSTGFFLWLPFRNSREELRIREGFLIVVLLWSVLCLFGSLPFIFSHFPKVSFIDALFESVSGLTTTGASVLSGLDELPHAIRFYRQQLQLLGGMGIIVLAVAILPMLGVGGMQLYQAEMPGHMKDTKLTPRITETAKALWYIYVGMVIICGFAYWGAGMTPFDAIGESFSTLATGGFTMHDTSFAYYKNSTVEIIAIVFMILSGTNYALHFIALQRRSLRNYWADFEFRMYFFILLSISLLTITTLILSHTFQNETNAVLKGVFNVVSLVTTTGFKSAPFHMWPLFIPFLIMLVAIIGSCAGSTCGGIKIIRVFLLHKQSLREVKRLLHPNAILNIKFGGKILPEHVIQAMWSFISIFTVLAVVIILALMATGLDVTTAFGAMVASLANAGAGIGKIAGGFEGISTTAKSILIIAMLAGRLEIFTLLVLFTPEFWKK